MDSASDRDLLAAARDGNGQAFDLFYRRHREAVLGYCAQRVRDPEAAADLMAEAFTVLLVTVHDLDRALPDTPLAWLFSVAHRKLIDSYRHARVESSARRRLQLGPMVLDDAAIARIDAIAQDTDAAAELAVSEQVVRRRASRARIPFDRGGEGQVMSDFLDTFGEQLALAGRELHEAQGLPAIQKPAKRPWYRPRGTILLLGATLSISVAALAASGFRHPVPGRPGIDDGPVRISNTQVPKEQLALLGVLRRPQTDIDRRVDSTRLLRGLNRGENDVRLGSIRLLNNSLNHPVALVSLEQGNRDPLCLLVIGGGSCASLDTILDGRALTFVGARVLGLVPDGVARVEFTFADGTTRLVPASQNFVELKGAIVLQTKITRVRWFNHAGEVIGPPLKGG